MRVLIISDTHGRHTAFDRAIMEAGKIDYLVHLGDTEGGEDYIEAFCGCPAYILAGNNDFFSRNLREMEIYFGKKKAFMAHGHQYSVSLGVERILDEGRSRNADIVMFGHTHRPYLNFYLTDSCRKHFQHTHSYWIHMNFCLYCFLKHYNFLPLIIPPDIFLYKHSIYPFRIFIHFYFYLDF